ncbi:MAG: gamma-glutamyltransferase [Burkholderiaceae bacterium]
MHLIAEALKIAFADRIAATADPDFVAVPVARLLSADYAAERRAQLQMDRALSWSAGVGADTDSHTTHVSVADADGLIVSATQTINSLFGARYIVPGTGIIPNNYLYVFDPRPGRANSLAAGKRHLVDGTADRAARRTAALCTGPAGRAAHLPPRFGAAQSDLTTAWICSGPSRRRGSGPRAAHWNSNRPSTRPPYKAALAARGHGEVMRVANVGGGMGAIEFRADGSMLGASCWRADGTPIGIGGGQARAGVRFLPEVLRH